MYLYVRGMYTEWCKGQDSSSIKEHCDEFVRMAAITFSYTEEYMLKFLKNTEWFKY